MLPDPGVPFQLVHHDDVAAALCAAVIGAGEPGVYNLAGPGELTISELAHELGWHAVPAPRQSRSAPTAEALAQVSLPARRGRLDRGHPPTGADGHRPAPAAELHWMPHHDARDTLRETISAVRSR